MSLTGHSVPLQSLAQQVHSPIDSSPGAGPGRLTHAYRHHLHKMHNALLSLEGLWHSRYVLRSLHQDCCASLCLPWPCAGFRTCQKDGSLLPYSWTQVCFFFCPRPRADCAPPAATKSLEPVLGQSSIASMQKACSNGASMVVFSFLLSPLGLFTCASPAAGFLYGRFVLGVIREICAELQIWCLR